MLDTIQMSDHISTLEQPATIAANAALMVAKEGSDKKSGTGRRGQEKEPQHPAGISGGDAEAAAPASPKKPLAFHLSFLALNTMVFIVSLDATTLAVALPVRYLRPSLFPLCPSCLSPMLQIQYPLVWAFKRWPRQNGRAES